MPLEFINPDTQTTATTNIATTIVNNTSQTNYITFPVAIANPLSNGWRIYADTAGVAPVDGTDGTTTGVTLTQETSAPLNSTGDFRLTKDAVNRQGLGISTDFTIANRHLSKVLQISFDYEVFSGTFADGDLRVYIIQDYGVTNTVIEPVNVSVQTINTGIRSRHLATFQTHVSLKNYRLCIHVASSSASAYTVDFNNFRVWETTQSIGSIITDWVSYTPTFSSANGFATTPTSINFISRRNGSTLEIIGSFIVNTTNSNTARIPLGFQGAEGNVTIDSSKLLSTSMVGRVVMRQSVPQGYIYNVLATGGNNYMEFGYAQNSGAEPFTAMPGTNFQSGVANGRVQIQATIPIAGWGSSVAMSSDTGDGRVVAFNAIGVSSTTYGDANSGVTNINFATVRTNTHGTYSSGVFTVPVAGVYRVTAKVQLNSATGGLWSIGIYKNGVRVSFGTYPANTMSNFAFTTATSTLSLLAGETISIRPLVASGSGNTCIYGTGSGSDQDDFSIERISAGSQVIAASETVALGYIKLADQTESSSQFAFPSRIYDTHGAWNGHTFTAPMAGYYNITFLVAGGSTNTAYFEIWKNNSYFQRYYKGVTELFTVVALMRLVAGDTIQLRPITGSSTTLTGGDYNGNSSFVYIHRIGI